MTRSLVDLAIPIHNDPRGQRLTAEISFSDVSSRAPSSTLLMIPVRLPVDEQAKHPVESGGVLT